MITWHQANSYPFLAKAMLRNLFENPFELSQTNPNSLLHALERWLAYYNPRLPNKAQKKESCRRDKKIWAS